jgi:hypothetical protein
MFLPIGHVRDLPEEWVSTVVSAITIWVPIPSTPERIQDLDDGDFVRFGQLVMGFLDVPKYPMVDVGLKWTTCSLNFTIGPSKYQSGGNMWLTLGIKC